MKVKCMDCKYYFPGVNSRAAGKCFKGESGQTLYTELECSKWERKTLFDVIEKGESRNG